MKKENLLWKNFLYFRKWNFLLSQEETLKSQAKIFLEFLKINLYILHHNILHNYYKKFLCIK